MRGGGTQPSRDGKGCFGVSAVLMIGIMTAHPMLLPNATSQGGFPWHWGLIPSSSFRDSASMLGMGIPGLSLAGPLEKPQMQRGLVLRGKSWEFPMSSSSSLVNLTLLSTIHTHLFKQRILPETEDEEEAAVSGPEGSEEML